MDARQFCCSRQLWARYDPQVNPFRRRSTRALPPPAVLCIQGRQIHLRASARARRLSLRVHEDGVIEAVAPPRLPRPFIEAFIQDQANWLEERLARVAQRPREAFPPPRLVLPSIGEEWALRQEAAPGPLQLREAAEGQLVLRGDWDDARARLLLRRWLTGRARDVLGVWLAEVAEEHGFRYNGLQIRLQRSRWGSCSSQGCISLNLAILFHLPAVLRYLLVHELAHTQHMNHSAHFWATVERCEPQWRELDAQLRGGWRRVPEWLRPRRRLPTAG